MTYRSWLPVLAVALTAVGAGIALPARREPAAPAPLAPPPAVRAIRAAAGGPLQAQAEAILGRNDGWSGMAWSVDRKEALFSIGAEKVRTPASNNKVFTSLWALSVLGPDYRFATDLLLGAAPRNGVLLGNLYLRGSGDPAFGYPAFDKDPLNSVRPMARALKARGIRVVEGNVVADASIFDTIPHGPKWPNDTGNGVSAYAPSVSGLAFQRNLLWVEVKNGAMQLQPDVPEIPVTRAGGRGMAVRRPENDTVTLRGSLGGPFRRYMIGVEDPALLAGAALRQALREQGIEVRGKVVPGETPATAKLVHRHYSVPLRAILYKMNRESDNFFAEHLWQAATAKTIGHGSYALGGSASARFFRDRAGVPLGQLWQADGSGLSSDNRLAPVAMVRALTYAQQQPWREIFEASLPIAGARDGTLKSMFRGTAAEGNLHAKTGFIRGVRALSGYVKAENGERIVFSFLYNGRNTSGARGLEQKLGTLLAEFSR